MVLCTLYIPDGLFKISKFDNKPILSFLYEVCVQIETIMHILVMLEQWSVYLTTAYIKYGQMRVQW